MGDRTKQLGWTIGSLLVGTSFNTYLFGVVLRQYGSYFSKGFEDPLWVRTTVRVLLVVDIIHSAIQLYVPWWYLVTNYNNPSMIAVTAWPLLINPLFESISVALTQNFLAHRLFRLNRRRKLRRMLLALIFGGFVSGLLSAAWPFCHDAQTWKIVQERIWYIYVVRYTLQSITDLIIAISLAVEFHNFRTGEDRSDRLLTRLMRRAIQTGGFAAFFSCGTSLTLSIPLNYVGLLSAVFVLPLGRIYSNALMDSLIMRFELRDVFMGNERLTEIVARGLKSSQTDSQNSTTSTVSPWSLAQPQISPVPPSKPARRNFF